MVGIILLFWNYTIGTAGLVLDQLFNMVRNNYVCRAVNF